ncbi:MAG: WD40 repeat domain-containing protein [Candidatus Thorarchaeota archaeon]
MASEELSLFLKPKILRPQASHGSEITRRFAMNRVGRMIAAAMQDRSIRFFDVENGDEVQKIQDDFLCTSIAFSPRGDIVVTGGVDRLIKIWDIKTGERLATLEGHSYPILSLSFSPDGDKFVSGSGDTTLMVWDVDNLQRLHHLKGHSLYVVGCEWDPSGNRIISAGVDGVIGVWDPSSGEKIDWIQEHRTAVHSIHFSSDGSLLASGSSDLSIVIWDATGKSLAKQKKLLGHSAEVRTVAFSSDSKYLASGSSDKDLFIWKLDDYTRAGESTTFSEVDGLEWLPNTHSFITADGTGAIVRWEVNELGSILAPFNALLKEIESDTDHSHREELIQKYEALKAQYDPEVLRDKRVFYVLWQCRRGLGLLKGKPRGA